MNTTENQSRLDWALQIAVEAGNVTLQHFRNNSLQVERKGDDSPVTIADKAAEELLRDRIAEKYPEDAIIGEEHGEKAGESGFTWVLDPIDGTKSFIHGIPLYTTLIGILYGEKSDIARAATQIGVIRAPALDEMVYSRRGGGTWHQLGTQPAEQVHVSQTASLAESVLLYTDVSSYFKRASGDGLQAILALDEASRLGRTWGDAYGYLMVATGRADVMLDAAMNLWDAAALQPVIEEAGGCFCDWQGAATVHSGEAVAANKTVMPAVLDILRGK